MIYTIYELVESSSLARLEGEDSVLMVLQRFYHYGMTTSHRSFDEACEDIYLYKEELHNKKFVVLPIINVDYEGKIE